MNMEGRRPIDDSLSPMPTERFGERLERLREESGLTWRKLAASAGIAQRDAIPLRRVKRFQPEPGHRGIVALARDLPGGCGLSNGGSYACDQTGNPDRLDRFRRAAGFTWGGLARELRVNTRTVRRWKAGSRVGSGHLVSLFALAARLGLLHCLLPEAGEPVAAAAFDVEGGGCAVSPAIQD